MASSNDDYGPLLKYYTEITDEELEDATGYPGDEYPCEEMRGYNMKHHAWYTARDEYYDALSDNALDLVELVSERDSEKLFLAYAVGGRVYAVSLKEVEDAIESYNEAEDEDDDFFYKAYCRSAAD